MLLLFVPQEHEGSPEFSVKFFGAISHHGQAAALLRTILRERCNNHVPTGSDCASDGANICVALLRGRQKMKDRAVMPDIVGVLWELDGCDVPFDPTNRVCCATEATLHCFKSRG